MLSNASTCRLRAATTRSRSSRGRLYNRGCRGSTALHSSADRVDFALPCSPPIAMTG